MAKTVTNVYIDGFNFFYGCLKGTPLKWVDLSALSADLLRGHRIGTVNYFTALVKSRSDDPQQNLRQEAYLRALRGAGVRIHFGQFQTRTKVVRLAKLHRRRPQYAKARVTEEKGTDVSLGAHLLWDAFHGEMTCALVISNDADLQVPLDMATKLGVSVITVNPHRHKGQKDHLAGSERRALRRSHLERNQFPHRCTTTAGDPSCARRGGTPRRGLARLSAGLPYLAIEEARRITVIVLPFASESITPVSVGIVGLGCFVHRIAFRVDRQRRL